jgi:hypothetical protein
VTLLKHTITWFLMSWNLKFGEKLNIKRNGEKYLFFPVVDMYAFMGFVMQDKIMVLFI